MDVRILDTLMILVGPNSERRDLDGSDEGLYLENWVLVLPLTLTAPRGRSTISSSFSPYTPELTVC